MENDRFDDVEFTFVEEPEGAPPPRRRRGLLAAAAVIVAGGLGLGATAIASQDEPPAPKAKPSFEVRDGQRGHGCRKGEGRHHRWDNGSEQDTALRY